MKNNVLLIDDDPISSGPYKRLLEKAAYVVHWIRSPEEAVREAGCHAKYSHALIDFKFKQSQLTGEDVARQMRWKWPVLPLVLITGFMNDEPSRRAYIRVEWDGCIEKEPAGLRSTMMEDYLVRILREAEQNMQRRVEREFSFSTKKLDATISRLDALEKALKAHAGKIDPFNVTELTLAACIFMSTGQDELDESDKRALRAHRLGQKTGDTELLAKKNVKMSTRNSWPPYFQLREDRRPSREFDCGKLATAAVCVRHLIQHHPGRWPRTCQEYEPVKDIVNEFDLGPWARGETEPPAKLGI